MKDWVGNANSVRMTNGISYSNNREENDFYATEPKATELLMQIESFSPNIWECACGQGHIAKILESNGYKVKSTDLIDRGYGNGGVDFLMQTEMFDGDIITNPPYRYAKEFVEKALELVPEGNKVCMFLKIQFLESQGRRKLFDKHPPKTVWVSSSRLFCHKNGISHHTVSMASYCWFVWEKGYSGRTTLRWFN